MSMQPQFGLPPPMMMAGPQFLRPAHAMMGPGTGPPVTFGGICFKCNQGYMARNCPTVIRGNFPQGGAGSQGGRNPFKGKSFRKKRG